MKLFTLIAFLCVLAFIGAGCSGTPKVDEMKIDKVDIAKDKDGKAGDVVTSFKSSDTKHYFVLTFNGGKKGTKIKGVFTAVEASGLEPNNKLNETELTTDNDDQATATFQIEVAAGFPPGNYKAEFFVDGKPAKTVTYKVE